MSEYGNLNSKETIRQQALQEIYTAVERGRPQEAYVWMLVAEGFLKPAHLVMDPDCLHGLLGCPFLNKAIRDGVFEVEEVLYCNKEADKHKLYRRLEKDASDKKDFFSAKTIAVIAAGLFRPYPAAYCALTSEQCELVAHFSETLVARKEPITAFSLETLSKTGDWKARLGQKNSHALSLSFWKQASKQKTQDVDVELQTPQKPKKR